MTTQEKVSILTSFSLFSQLPQKELQDLAQHVLEKTFQPKQFIVQQSIAASVIYLIYDGLIQIYIETDEGKTIPIRIKHAPYIVGEMNLFDNLATANVQALQESHAFVLSQKIFAKLLHSYSHVSLELLKIINEKLRAANIHTEYYFSQKLKDRIQGIIQTLSLHFPQKEIPLSQEELAYIVGASRSKVTKALDELEKEHIISLFHKKIRFLSIVS